MATSKMTDHSPRTFCSAIMIITSCLLCFAAAVDAATCICESGSSLKPCLASDYSTNELLQVGLAPYTSSTAICRLALCYFGTIQSYYGIQGPFNGRCDASGGCPNGQMCTTMCGIGSQQWDCISNKWTLISWSGSGNLVVIGCSCPSTSPTPVDTCAPSSIGGTLVPTSSLPGLQTDLYCSLSPTNTPSAAPSLIPSRVPSPSPSKSPSKSPSSPSTLLSGPTLPPSHSDTDVASIVGVAVGSAVGASAGVLCCLAGLMLAFRSWKRRINEEAMRNEKRLEGIMEAVPVPTEPAYAFQEAPVDDQQVKLLTDALSDIGIIPSAALVYAKNFQQGGCMLEDVFMLSPKELEQYKVRQEDIKKIRRGVSRKQQEKIDALKYGLRDMGMGLSDAADHANDLFMVKDVPTIDALIADASLQQLKKYGLEEQVINNILQAKFSRMQSRDDGEGYDVFISYAQKDTTREALYLAEQLKNDARLANIRLFRDQDSQFNLHELIPKVQIAKVVVCMLSTNYCTRPFCMVELFYALRSEGVRIVPVNAGGFDHTKMNAIIEDKAKLKGLLDKKGWRTLAGFGLGVKEVQDALRKVTLQKAWVLNMGDATSTLHAQVGEIKTQVTAGLGAMV